MAHLWIGPASWEEAMLADIPELFVFRVYATKSAMYGAVLPIQTGY